MNNVNHDAPVVRMRTVTTEPDECSRFGYVANKSAQILAASLVAMQWFCALLAITPALNVLGEETLRKHTVRNERRDRQRPRPTDWDRAKALASKTKPLVAKPVIDPNDKHIRDMRLAKAPRDDTPDQRQKLQIVIVGGCDKFICLKPPNLMVNHGCVVYHDS